ncbi:MAG: tRNA 2-thiocytidine biosynthesis protein TtcA [Clostridia bacterium]|nr:tRNA 2-thiocytidine biosynthesis protein TtcA [Clostridia bacterium]
MREFKHIQKLLSQVRRAVDGYDMINACDTVAVGVSGGKDSLTLLCALKALSRFYSQPFDVKAICLDTGVPGLDLDPVKRLCAELDVELMIEKTDIYQIVFELRKESNPCSLCANLRRGALYDTAVANGIKKVALGHHYDDALETFFMNLFNEGRIACFSPVTYLDRTGVTLIRPLIYTPEADVKRFVAAENIETVKKACPADGFTDREKMKNFIRERERADHGFKKRVFGAMERGNVSGFKVVPHARKKRSG